MTDQEYRSVRRRCYVVVFLPMWSLFLYMPLSLIAYHYCEPIRHFVDGLHDRLTWLSAVFPLLDRYEQAVQRRDWGLSLGYYFHAYGAGLVANAAAAALVMARWRLCKAAFLELLRRNVSMRRRFDDEVAAATFYATVCGGIALYLIFTFWNGGLFTETFVSARRPSWLDQKFLIWDFPMMMGVAPSFLLGSIVALGTAFDPAARTLKWGVEAAREEAARDRDC
jgi:hypothetical protein